MASRIASIDPPRTPSTPTFVITDTDDGEPSFPSFPSTFDDRDRDHDHDRRWDRDRDRDPPVANSPDRNRDRSHFLAASPQSTPADFLRPRHSASLRPPTPDSVLIMATDDGLASGDSDAQAPKNPFNFQTQFISTGPVKSVRYSCRTGRVVDQTANHVAMNRTSANDEVTATNTAR